MAILSKLKKLACMTSTATLLAVSFAPQAHAGYAVRVGKSVPPSFAFAFLDVGMKTGIFAKHGLEVDATGFGGGARLLQAMAADAIDIGLASGTSVALISKGAEITPFYTISETPDFTMIANAKSDVNDLDGMKGKKITVGSKTSLSGWISTYVSEKKGWGKDGLDLIPSRMGAAIALLRTGEVTAITADFLLGLDLTDKGVGKIIYQFKEDIPKFPIYVLYATNDMIEKNPEKVKAFAAAWSETIAFAKENRDETVDIIATTLSVNPAVVGQAYDAAMGNFSTDGKTSQEAIDMLVRNFKDAGNVPDGFDTAGAFTTEYLPAAD